MTRWLDSRRGKRTTRPVAKEEPLLASVIITEYRDSPGVTPISDATVRDETMIDDQVIFQPYVDIQHTWRCGELDVRYGFSVSGAGVLIIDDTVYTTGRLLV